MDIAALASTMSQMKISNAVGTAMLSKQLDTQEVMGSQIVNMIDKAGMERSVNPSVGSNFDVSV